MGDLHSTSVLHRLRYPYHADSVFGTRPEQGVDGGRHAVELYIFCQ